MFHFTGWIKKICLNQIQIYLRILLRFKIVEKSNLSGNFWAPFWDITFLIKKRNFLTFNQKTIEKHSFAVGGTFCGEKRFLLIFVPFYWFDKNQLFILNPNFQLDFFLFKLLSKSKFLNNSELLSEWVIFDKKRDIFSKSPPKSFKTTG